MMKLQTRSESPSTDKSPPQIGRIQQIKQSSSSNNLSQSSNPPKKRAGRKKYFTDEDCLKIPEDMLYSPDLQAYLRNILQKKKGYSQEKVQKLVQSAFVSNTRKRTRELLRAKIDKEDQQESIPFESSSFQSTPKHNQRNFLEMSPKLDDEMKSFLFSPEQGSANNISHENSEDRIKSHGYFANNEDERSREISEIHISFSHLHQSNSKCALDAQHIEHVEFDDNFAHEVLYGHIISQSSPLLEFYSSQSQQNTHISSEIQKIEEMNISTRQIHQTENILEQYQLETSSNEKLQNHENPQSINDDGFNQEELPQETVNTEPFYSLDEFFSYYNLYGKRTLQDISSTESEILEENIHPSDSNQLFPPKPFNS